tara:strand:- start:297 stop:650 length:354 start_codon:yes stop_codon:yes gene_type:complete
VEDNDSFDLVLLIKPSIVLNFLTDRLDCDEWAGIPFNNGLDEEGKKCSLFGLYNQRGIYSYGVECFFPDDARQDDHYKQGYEYIYRITDGREEIPKEKFKQIKDDLTTISVAFNRKN